MSEAKRPSPCRTTIDSGGRVVLPAEYRRALGVKPGDEVVLVLGEGEVRVMTAAQALRSARTLLAPYLEHGPDPVATLVAERRRAAKREAKSE